MHRLRLFCEMNFLSLGHDKIKKPIKSNTSLSLSCHKYVIGIFGEFNPFGTHVTAMFA